MIDEVLARRAGCFCNRILRLALGTDKEYLAATGRSLAYKIERAGKERHGLRKIQNMDAIAIAKDVRLHFWIPAVCLVSKVCASFQELVHGDSRCRHGDSLLPVGPLGSENEAIASHRFMMPPMRD